MAGRYAAPMIPPLRATLVVLLLSSCGDDPSESKEGAGGDGESGVLDSADSGEPWVQLGCGDGALDPGEECDSGADNSDTVADACRSDCSLPRCGDGVVDSTESCDDGGVVAGDGCDANCVTETDLAEVEPNDSWDAPQALGEVDTLRVVGALPEGDRDCFSIVPPVCGAVDVSVSGDCPGPLALSLHAPTGVVMASGAATADACAVLSSADSAGARFLGEGEWAVCLDAPLSDPSQGYALDWMVRPVEDTEFELSSGEDPDGDGVPDQCDSDDDGDLLPDDDDLCPDFPDGPDAPTLQSSDSGFVTHWLAAGPFTGTSSTSRCRPSEDALVHATDDALVIPELAAAAGSTVWRVLSSGSERIDFLPEFGHVSADREVYTAAWVRGIAGVAVLAIGPDDGARAWLDGVEVLDIDGCQGTNIDQFQADVTLTGDWQLLVLKVRDHGGGWGNYARFLDEGGDPIADLEVSLRSDGGPLDSFDTDGDGLGDACDPTPAG